MQPVPDHQLSANGMPRCGACNDVIGVYEPLVEVFAGLTRRTSRAAEPDIDCSDGRCYHLGCYQSLGGEL
jgi:hypothetical protein